ncbi:MAG: acetyl-CoA hydrolase/transferase family protein [Syntrophales bacterium]
MKLSKEDKAWNKEEYNKKLVSVEDAAKVVKSGDRISTGMASSAPIELLKALSARKDELEDVHIYSGLTFYPFPFLRGDFKGHINYHSFFLAVERKFLSEGNIEISSIPLSHFDYWHANVAKPDIAMIEATPPDENGYMSFGPVGASKNRAIVNAASKIIVQVNKSTPRVSGSKETFIHVSDVDYICEVDYPLTEIPSAPILDEERIMAEHIAGEIPDGACLQIGIGGTPDAICKFLLTKNDLGIHSELVMHGIMELHKNGNITGARKTIDRGKIINGGVVGTKECYDWASSTSEVEFRPSSYCNNPLIIAQNDNQISINSALFVDLSGQIVAESIGFNQFSGCGGQHDFAMGARLSNGGKAFIALPATYPDKKSGGFASRIVSVLPPGSRVTTPHMLVHFVTTEFGIVDLRDKSFSDRAKALIGIAHPDLRDKLTSDAKTFGLIS